MAYILLCMYTHTHTHTHKTHILSSFICWWTFRLISYLVGCCCSASQSSPTLCDLKYSRTTGFPVLHHLPELALIHLYCVNGAIQPSHSLTALLLLPSIFPSIRVFSDESALHIRWPKYYSFSFSISPSNEYSGFISFRIDWLYLLAVQRTLKSLFQHHNLKASLIFWHSAFFMVHFLCPYMTTGKTILCMDLCQQSSISTF